MTDAKGTSCHPILSAGILWPETFGVRRKQNPEGFKRILNLTTAGNKMDLFGVGHRKLKAEKEFRRGISKELT